MSTRTRVGLGKLLEFEVAVGTGLMDDTHAQLHRAAVRQRLLRVLKGKEKAWGHGVRQGKDDCGALDIRSVSRLVHEQPP